MGLDLSFDYDKRLRSEIHADLLYDAFTLAVVKGFGWGDVCKAVIATEQLLKELIGMCFIIWFCYGVYSCPRMLGRHGLLLAMHM